MLNKLIEIVKSGGLPIISLFVFLEGNPIIGTLIPGQFLIIFFGFILSTEQKPNLLLIILIISLSSYIGDIIGYHIGKKYGINGLKKLNINVENQIYKRSKNFFNKYGTFAIILGREFNLTRAFIPFLTGTLNYKLFKFLIICAISNILWATISILLGYYFGTFIIHNFKLFLQFIFVTITYITMIIFTCKAYNTITKTKKKTFEKYGIHHYAHIISTIIILILTIMISKNTAKLNQYLNIIFAPIINFIGKNILKYYSNTLLLIILSLTIITINLFTREVKLLNGFLWGGFFTTFIYLILNKTIENIFHIKILFSITIIIYTLFYLWITIKNYLTKTKKTRYLQVIESLLIILTMLIFLIITATKKEISITLITLVISAIITELITIISKYCIINQEIYKIYKLKTR